MIKTKQTAGNLVVNMESGDTVYVVYTDRAGNERTLDITGMGYMLIISEEQSKSSMLVRPGGKAQFVTDEHAQEIVTEQLPCMCAGFFVDASGFCPLHSGGRDEL